MNCFFCHRPLWASEARDFRITYEEPNAEFPRNSEWAHRACMVIALRLFEAAKAEAPVMAPGKYRPRVPQIPLSSSPERSASRPKDA